MIQDSVGIKKAVLTLLEAVRTYRINDRESAESFRLKFLSKKGQIPQLFVAFKKLPPQEKKELGRLLNQLKQLAEEKFGLSQTVDVGTHIQKKRALDMSLPPLSGTVGALHPLSQVHYRIIEIFERIGFNTVEGPEIEDDWHNFSALNFPANHPARDMQDTFFLHKNPIKLLRTHTSNVQIRLMGTQSPPIRAIMPGRVYRNETVSARSHMFFNQIEGLYVDTDVSFVDLKQTLYHFAKEMYGKHIAIRFRPSFFPFTEPSAEIDISCLVCNRKGCPVCKYSGWVEIAGSGMVHPNVLENCNIDTKKYTGFAFGMGVERVAQLKYRINDIRLYSENDIRFLHQFKSMV